MLWKITLAAVAIILMGDALEFLLFGPTEPWRTSAPWLLGGRVF